MGANQCANSITIEFGCQFSMDIRNGNLTPPLTALASYCHEILYRRCFSGFGEKAMV